MKKLKFLYIPLLASLSLWTSCAPEYEGMEVVRPNANFQKYIAIGNSLSAGFADGGLYLEGQQVAFPNLIAQQLKHVGGGDFVTPFFSEEQSNGSGYLRLVSLENGSPQTEPVTDKLAIRGQNPNGQPLYTRYTGGAINNFGVPGMRLDMAFTEGIGTVLGNPYFERLLPENTSPATTFFGYTTSQEHTFFTFWLGNNDALQYAMNGAVNAGPTTTLTELPLFTMLYNNYINALTAGGQKGAVANIPDVTSIPYFTTVTYAQIMQGVRAATNNAVENIFIETKTGPRAATESDYFVLTFPTAELGQPNAQGIPYGFHPLNAIKDELVLDQAEAEAVKKRVSEYNTVIKQVAESKGLAFVDVHSFLNRVKAGTVYNGVPLSSSFIVGNAFSLDGVHLTPIGNGIVANLFIQAINNQYGGSIPIVDVTHLSGVKMPD